MNFNNIAIKLVEYATAWLWNDNNNSKNNTKAKYTTTNDVRSTTTAHTIFLQVLYNRYYSGSKCRQT